MESATAAMVLSLASMALSGIPGAMVNRIFSLSDKHEKKLEKIVEEEEFLRTVGQRKSQFHQDVEQSICRLGEKISGLEELVQARLREPSFLACRNQATIAAVQTDNRTKRQVLSDILVQRLLNCEGSEQALYQQTAIEALEYLSAGHLNLLATLFVVCEVCPFPPKAKNSFPSWWKQLLTPLSEGWTSLHWTPGAGGHLASVGCIRVTAGFTSDLYEAMAGNCSEARGNARRVSVDLVKNFLEEERSLMESLNSQWGSRAGMMSTTRPTPAGGMIGYTAANALIHLESRSFEDAFTARSPFW